MHRRAIKTLMISATVLSACLFTQPLAAQDGSKPKQATPKETPHKQFQNATPEQKEEARNRLVKIRNRREDARAKALQSLWWNNPTVAAGLKLTDKQKKKLSKLGDELVELPSAVSERARIQKELEDFLRKGDLESAKKHAEKLASVQAEHEKARLEKFVEMFSVLTPEQLKLLAEAEPNAFLIRNMTRGTRRASPSAGTKEKLPKQPS